MTTLPNAIGPYTIEREIGRGGMGVVYLGHDTRLDRAVAIKSLPGHFASDTERLARFEREAKTLASLNHPNVAGIHGIEEADGNTYLILEYVEGETLADRLDRGPLPIDDVIEICTQIAAGVEAAHEAGVIHRDLKPANIKITPEGQAKVLDFGLARTEETSSSGSSMSQLPTLTTPHSPTTPGAILGTAPYMSPEQARGRRVDKRSDIWSFGVVLYECLTGASPFVGETASDSIGAILHKDVDLDRLPPNTPRDIRHVIERCLERDKSMRLRDIGDARIEIERAIAGDTGVNAATQARHSRLAWISAAIVGALAVYASWSAWMSPGQIQSPMVLATIQPPPETSLVIIGDLAGPVSLSRDGTNMVFSAKHEGEQQQLYLRSLSEAESQPIRGTQGAIFPFWSWDGHSIGYFVNSELRRYDLTTRTNKTICPAPGARGGAWLADNRIIFAPGFQSPLYSVPADGGELTLVTTIDTTRHSSHRWPSPTSDGASFIYLAVNHTPDKLDESAIYLASRSGGPDIEVTRATFAGTIVNDQLLIVRENTLFATRFDGSTGALSQDITPIAENIVSDLTTWYAPFSASQSGLLAFHALTNAGIENNIVSGIATWGESKRSVVMQRDGRPAYIFADGIPQNTVSVSPDGTLAAISAAPEGQTALSGFDIWLYRLPFSFNLAIDEAGLDTGGSLQNQLLLSDPPRRLTFLNMAEISPCWSPDGEWLAFGLLNLGAQDSDMPAGLYRVRTSGGQPEMLLASIGTGANTEVLVPTQCTPDGRYIIYTSGNWIGDGINDLFAFDLETKTSLPIVTGLRDELIGKVSPDGKWFAYDSNATGSNEVFVIPFKPGWEDERSRGLPTPQENARWRISIAGGTTPHWNPAGGELFYISASNSMVAVNVSTDGVLFNHDVGTMLFATPNESGGGYDVSLDGQRFVISSEPENQNSIISLLINWQELLQQ